MSRTRYTVTTTHPTGYLDGKHTLEVSVNDYLNGNGARFVSGANLGCSRDYSVKTDKEAIRLFLSEHMMTPVTVRKSK